MKTRDSTMRYLWPSEEQMSALRSRRHLDAKVTMLNLLKFRETADYSDHPDEAPCSGAEAYQRYSRHAAGCLESVGGRLLFSGQALGTVIGPVAEGWDAVLLVEYPSLGAFLGMTSSEAYRAIAYHRTAAVEDSRLIPIVAGEGR